MYLFGFLLLVAVGKDADIVIFDKEINIKHTFVSGKNVYQKEEII
ncbi:hypothetical protein [Velocimicrobium porci]|nr:hypothetical protein [Velocimicrobium porci]